MTREQEIELQQKKSIEENRDDEKNVGTSEQFTQEIELQDYNSKNQSLQKQPELKEQAQSSGPTKNNNEQKLKEPRLKTILGEERYRSFFVDRKTDGHLIKVQEYYVDGQEVKEVDLASLYIERATIEEIVGLADDYIGTSNKKGEAIELYQFAAAKGNQNACYRLGNCYPLIGFTEAFANYLLAANSGHAKAQFKVARYYSHGRPSQGHDDFEIKKDPSLAIHFFHLSAGNGYAPAQRELGHCYWEGKGVEKNWKEAARLYQLSAEQGDVQGQYFVALCYLNGCGFDKDQKKAVQYFRSADEKGDPNGQFFLGQCYEYGLGVEIDAKQAFSFYQAAAQKKHPEAQYCLASCYERGFGVQENWREAYRCYYDLASKYPSHIAKVRIKCSQLAVKLGVGVVNSIVRNLDRNATRSSSSVNTRYSDRYRFRTSIKNSDSTDLRANHYISKAL